MYLSYWRLVVSQILTTISHANRLQLIIKRLPTTFNPSYLTTSNAFKNKVVAQKKLTETIANSNNLRRQHLSDLALDLKLNGDYTKGKAIQQLITIEYKRSLHSTINHHFNPITKSTLSTIEVPTNAKDWNSIPKDDSIQWKTESDPQVIEKLLIKRNIHHLFQAEGTLFTTNKMKNIIGNDGCSPDADEILMGTFNHHPNLLTPLQVQYFNNLQCKNRIQPAGAPETINMNDIKEGYKMERKTSTSPSNRHLGHYKLLLATDKTSKKDQNTASSDTIWQIITTLINASTTLSTPITRWQNFESIMFEKEEGNSNINRLRIINQYEADYNVLLKAYCLKITNNIAGKNNTLGTKKNWRLKRERVRWIQQ